MKERFFNPYKGPEYDKGICGKKVLVLGASFYCPKKDCKFWSECTNPEKKDSSKFDEICPYYANVKGHPKLSDEPTNAIGDAIKTYRIFAELMYQFLTGEEKEQYKGYDEYVIWNKMAFTDYVQFFLPTTNTYPSYFSNRDFDAFVQTIQELKPDVIIAWGLPVTAEIRDNPDHKDLFTDLEKLPETEKYICHMKVPGIEHTITYVNCYHPSSRTYWYSCLESLSTYLRQVFNN